MDQTEQRKKEFCSHCSKEKDDCIEVDGQKFCCHDCHKEFASGAPTPKANVCEFC